MRSERQLNSIRKAHAAIQRGEEEEKDRIREREREESAVCTLVLHQYYIFETLARISELHGDE